MTVSLHSLHSLDSLDPGARERLFRRTAAGPPPDRRRTAAGPPPDWNRWRSG
ncbi:hypothetical protein [Streptomyces anulatus]|uniref:hypothetical protein n=1 Tax=Streptomyces anulatus TaxID=1892 RepID=UPI00364706D0